ncbi:MAG: TnpV protein [Clostridia bacterium]|nr:TnpV protein [Clostridia bacterium]
MKSLSEKVDKTRYFTILTLKSEALKGTYGVWGMLHREFLYENDKVRFYTLVSSGKLHQYLTQVDVKAEKLFEETVKQLAKKEGLTEKIKKKNLTLWTQKMNSIRNHAAKIVNTQVIFV